MSQKAPDPLALAMLAQLRSSADQATRAALVDYIDDLGNPAPVRLGEVPTWFFDAWKSYFPATNARNAATALMEMGHQTLATVGNRVTFARWGTTTLLGETVIAHEPLDRDTSSANAWSWFANETRCLHLILARGYERGRSRSVLFPPPRKIVCDFCQADGGEESTITEAAEWAARMGWTFHDDGRFMCRNCSWFFGGAFT
jgi:hypothetical protein